MAENNSLIESGEIDLPEHDELALAFNEWVREHTQPYRKLMSFYTCAMMEVETKFRVLNEDLSLKYDRNPIESIITRLKKPESIMQKLARRGLPMSVSSIENNIYDIAGVRVMCSFQSDVYMLADALLSQDDITLIEKKDYIKNPKPNGYRSLHLIVGVPIFLHNEKRQMCVEVQLRTLAMNLWANTEHKIRYKKNYTVTPEDSAVLLECAEECAAIDRKLEELYGHIRDAEGEPGIVRKP